MLDKELYDLNSYKIFYVTATCSSFSQAASKYGLTQPAISQAIRSIEDQLGLQLFKRTNSGVKLTKAGQTLLYYVEKSFDSLSSGVKIIEELKNEEISEINIGVPAHIGAFYFMRHLKSFNDKHPNLKINIIDKSSTEMRRMLEKKELDLLIDTDLVETSDRNITIKKIKDLTGIFVGNKTFKELASQKTVSVQKLTEYPLILPYSTTATRKLIDSSFRRRNIAITPKLQTNSTFIALNLIDEGMGIGWLLSDVVQKEIADGNLYEIKVEVDPVKIPLSYAYQSQNINNTIQEIIDVLKEK